MRTLRRAATLALLSLLAAVTAATAQPPSATPPAGKDDASRTAIVTEMIQRGVAAADAPFATRPFRSVVSGGGNDLVAALLIAMHTERAGYRALLDALESRADTQIGAAPANKGSTSLVMKGLVPEILGIAVENGALTEETKGTVMTFRTTPSGVVKALQGRGLLDAYVDYAHSPGLRFASRFSAAASFDTSRGPSATTFTGDIRQLASWSARAEIVNHRDAASQRYALLWAGLLRDTTYQKAAAGVESALGGWTEFEAWEQALADAVEANVDAGWTKDKNVAAAAVRFKALIEASLPALQGLKNVPKPVADALDTYVAQLTRVQKIVNPIYDFAGKGLLVTFDWTTARDKALPDLYTTTAIVEAGLGASRKTDFSLNAAASFYQKQPATASHAFKSFDAAAQLEHPLGTDFALPSATLSIAAKYSYLPNDTVASTTAAAGTAGKGSIVFVQGKLSVPIKGSGMKVPLSVTASNRTELIKEKDVRASVGITFDLDSFLTAISAKGR